MGSELVHLLEQEARTEKDKVLTDARARADELLAAARREAEETLAASRRRLDAERTQAQTQAASTASLKAAALVLAAKDEAIRKVFQGAEAALRSAVRDPGRRRATLRDLLREAAAGLPSGHAVAEASPGDVPAVRDACRDLGLDAEVRESSGVTDGVRLTSRDGRLVVENTVPSRLARARRELVSRVAETLWGA